MRPCGNAVFLDEELGTFTHLFDFAGFGIDEPEVAASAKLARVRPATAVLHMSQLYLKDASLTVARGASLDRPLSANPTSQAVATRVSCIASARIFNAHSDGFPPLVRM